MKQYKVLEKSGVDSWEEIVIPYNFGDLIFNTIEGAKMFIVDECLDLEDIEFYKIQERDISEWRDCV